jgi:hypothetical protein
MGGRLLLVTALVAASAAFIAAPSRASNGIKYGIQDDAWIEFGPGKLNQRLDTIKRLGVPFVRFTVHWDVVAPKHPKDPTSPRDRAYDWRRSDRVLLAIRRHGLTPVVTLLGTPSWANSGKAPNYAPVRPRDFRAFAQAAAARYSWVRYWLMWNEPNHPLWLKPTRASIYVDHVLNPGYEGIHAVLPHALVGGGVTAPRGGLGGVAPVTWLHGMARAHAKLDAYAHNPYPLRPGETPSGHGCRFCPTITMATLPKLLILVRRYWGLKPVWLTEYGYQTNPPDQFLGVSPRKQATLLSLAAMRAWRLARVTMLIQYLYRDEPELSRFQTALVYIDDKLKPSLNAFKLPFAEMRRSGFETVVWGQLRDGKPGRQQYQVQVLRRNHWQAVAGTRLTNDNGVFVRTIRLQKGSLLRVWSPKQRLYSLRLRVR